MPSRGGKRKRPLVVAEADEAAHLRRELGLHPGLVYVRNPSIGAKQWVLADRAACASAAAIAWRGVTVVSAGPEMVLVAGRRRGGRRQAPDGAWAPMAPAAGAVVEVWRAKELLSAVACDSRERLEAAIAEAYDRIGADAD